MKNRILTVYELHIYKLLKFFLRSLNNLHSENFLNNFFSFEKSRNTRSHSLRLLNEPLCKTKFERCSVRYRAVKLYNILARHGVFETMTGNTAREINLFYHKLKEGYILNNQELVKHSFRL